MNAYTNQYQHNQILTASQEQILLMLYDGAIRFCRQAIEANDRGDIPYKLGRIAKVFAIVTEFSNSLNHEIGGSIAEDLDGLYHFMLKELGHARGDTTGKHLKDVEKLLIDLRQTWAEAVQVNKKEQAALLAKQNYTTQDNQLAQPVKSLSTSG